MRVGRGLKAAVFLSVASGHGPSIPDWQLNSTAMFLRSWATPELWRRVNLRGGGCFCAGTQEEQQMDDIRVKMHSRFQSGDCNESFSRVRNVSGADSLEG